VLSAQPVDPILLSSPVVQVFSREEKLVRRVSDSDAIAIFECIAANAYAEPNDPSSIHTRLTLLIRQSVKGVAPVSVEILGGIVGNLKVTAVHSPRVEVGSNYIGFFRTASIEPQPPQLFLASEVSDDGQFSIAGDEYNVSSVIAAVATGGGAP
jgi:hypothetical protein